MQPVMPLYGNCGNIWNSYYECYNALQCNHLHIKIYDERPPLIIVQLTCSGLREDEDRRDVGRRWLQQEQLWICVREAPDMLVFAIFHLQIWPTFKIRMQPGMSLLKNKNHFRQFSLNEFSLNSSSDVPPKPSKWFSGGGCFERLKLSADLSVVYNRRSDVSASRWRVANLSQFFWEFILSVVQHVYVVKYTCIT